MPKTKTTNGLAIVLVNDGQVAQVHVVVDPDRSVRKRKAISKACKLFINEFGHDPLVSEVSDSLRDEGVFEYGEIQLSIVPLSSLSITFTSLAD